MSERLKRASRRWLYIPFAVAAVVFAGYALLWRAGAAEMKSSVYDWILAQRSAGLEISHGEIRSVGFPFFLRLRIDAPSIAAPDQWRWRAERLFLDALPYDLRRLILSPEGEQFLWAKGQDEWRVNAADIRASIADDAERGWAFAMSVDKASARRARDGAAIVGERLVLDLAPDVAEPTTITLSLAANAIESVNNDQRIGPADLNAALSLSHAQWLSAADGGAAWRDAGGALRIDGLFGEFEDARLSVSGAVALDGAGYPAGTLKAQITNPAVLARLLGKAGALEPQEAEAAAAGLALMALGGGGQIAAPIELKDGFAKIGGVKLADLPRL
jgi:hypothetical protein